jgi:deoxycytidylate deaminase
MAAALTSIQPQLKEKPMTNATTTPIRPIGARVGPCAKQQVRCTLVHPDGRRWVGENLCANAQETCPRAGMPTGQGYELCASVCRQMGHAEEQAARTAGLEAAGARAYLEGHTYACDNCKSVLLRAGVREITIGAPPAG